MTSATLSPAPASKGANIGIWAAQTIGAALFIMSGVFKLFTPIPELAAMMPWAGHGPGSRLRNTSLPGLGLT